MMEGGRELSVDQDIHTVHKVHTYKALIEAEVSSHDQQSLFYQEVGGPV